MSGLPATVVVWLAPCKNQALLDDRNPINGSSFLFHTLSIIFFGVEDRGEKHVALQEERVCIMVNDMVKYITTPGPEHRPDSTKC